MDRTERFYKIQNMLNERRAVPTELFLERLEISRATLKRDIEYLRDRLGAPILWDRKLKGYRFDDDNPAAQTFQLPGLWFTANELHALITLGHMLDQLQPGLLSQQIWPLKARIRNILGSGDHSADEVARRVKILHVGARAFEPKHFQLLSNALFNRLRVKISHYKRQTGETSERTVSPQRLVHYRDNWYLDTWCHLRRGLRTFSVDAIDGAELTQKKARDIPDDKLDASLGAGYGIFGGAHTHKAKLLFNAKRARWVSREHWHSQQSGYFELDGSYVLEVPYSDHRELMMDILKYGPDVQVLEPESLREQVKQQLSATSAIYDD